MAALSMMDSPTSIGKGSSSTTSPSNPFVWRTSSSLYPLCAIAEGGHYAIMHST
jgi:hypothetical protein